MTRDPDPGVIVMLRRLVRSGPGDAAPTVWPASIARITIRISSIAKLAPMQRRRPPPNGIQV